MSAFQSATHEMTKHRWRAPRALCCCHDHQPLHTLPSASQSLYRPAQDGTLCKSQLLFLWPKWTRTLRTCLIAAGTWLFTGCVWLTQMSVPAPPSSEWPVGRSHKLRHVACVSVVDKQAPGSVARGRPSASWATDVHLMPCSQGQLTCLPPSTQLLFPSHQFTLPFYWNYSILFHPTRHWKARSSFFSIMKQSSLLLVCILRLQSETAVKHRTKRQTRAEGTDGGAGMRTWPLTLTQH